MQQRRVRAILARASTACAGIVRAPLIPETEPVLPAPVEVSAARDGEWLAFAVSDRGPGIPGGERQRIFEPFYRPPGTAPDAPDAHGGGAGLGLSIARGIADAQGGSLSVRDREGGGAVFTLRVPFMKTS